MRKLIAILTVIMLLLSLVCLTGCEQETPVGRVYFINSNPEADEMWQKLAQEYTETTGVQVKVYSVSQENAYAEVLAAMNSDWVPSMFLCQDQEELKRWEGYVLELTDSAVYKACDERGFNLEDDQGKVWGVGYSYQVFGMIVNTQLLTQAGYEVTDITDFASLKAVAEDITARREELGFAAFASAGTDARFAQQIANMVQYYDAQDLENFKNLWDLYLDNAQCTREEMEGMSQLHAYNAFTSGEAVFYQNDAGCYDRLISAGMEAENLTMIPLYCGVEGEENAGLCCGTEDYWVVNAKAPIQDQEATLKFLEWVVNTDSCLQALAQQFGGVPFKKARTPENVFFHAAGALYDAGKYTVTWEYADLVQSRAWTEQFLSALKNYSQNMGDWAAVEAAYAACKQTP